MLSAWRLNVKAGDVEFVIEIVNVPHNAVGAGMPAKNIARWMARASPVFAGKPAPTGIAPAFRN
ncbi:hypothetical protein EZZ80_06325 [Pseudomonas putida]|nr:hypothetical protein DM483_09555 [Pseudomonas sp. SMT-1]QDW56913.1 hypothetical protein FFH79_008550 [Pseudomonas sp. KBS0802]UZA73136.1 hypothetical protein EZZ80_06325 [Pseudomonas putida]